MFPTLAHGVVLSADTDKHLVTVAVPSAQIVGLRCRTLHHGYADGKRVSQRPLPKPGTGGLIAFPYGDSRNGVWLGSLYLGDVDALHTGDADADYEAHWSGFWRLMQADGSDYRSYPDGTTISIAENPTPPAINRQEVDGTQTRVPVPYGPRVGTAPAPRPIIVDHASGTVVSIAANGATSVALAQNQPLTMTFGGATLTLTGNGAVTLDLGSGAIFNIAAGGGSGSDFLVKVTELVAWLISHTHKDSGAGTPNQPLTAAMVATNLVSVAS